MAKLCRVFSSLHSACLACFDLFQANEAQKKAAKRRSEALKLYLSIAGVANVRPLMAKFRSIFRRDAVWLNPVSCADYLCAGMVICH